MTSLRGHNFTLNFTPENLIGFGPRLHSDLLDALAFTSALIASAAVRRQQCSQLVNRGNHLAQTP